MQTVIAGPERDWLIRAKEYILAGEVVAFHTETVYGLGADARNDKAVRRIFALKGRPADNPLIAHVHADYEIKRLVDEFPAYAEKLRRAFLPGPLTLVCPSTGKVSGFVSCGLNTLAIRVPSSPVAQAFLREVNLPIVAPSANLSGHVSPVTAQHVFQDFEGKIPLILDGGVCEGGIESTVLDCTGPVPRILRAGLVTREMIADVAGACEVYSFRSGEKPKSPGLAYRHYVPHCKTASFSAEELSDAVALYRKEEQEGGKPCFLCENGLVKQLAGYAVLDLGENAGQLGHRLYLPLHAAEEIATLLIAVLPRPQEGGVMDGVLNRLTRACGGGHGV